MRYNHNKIESKWQKCWEERGCFITSRDLSTLKSKPKYYILDMFPYPSASGLHVGHPSGYSATDVIARMKRLQGYNVLHPIGWDAFGLPAERAALRSNIHPSKITINNINNFRVQIKRLGFSYDWSREINTSDKKYYKWTQWIFSKLYKKKLAYLDNVSVNWCPALSTVLANEEVKDGKYIETGDNVEKRFMLQWMLKITDYAERLINDLDDLDWPDNVKNMQRNWIGKSEGINISFNIYNSKRKLIIFTTKPETIFGVTYCVLSIDHSLINHIITDNYKKYVLSYIKKSASNINSNYKKNAENKDGVFTGSFAVHPITNKKIPIWISNYVLPDYSTGAIMGVPDHDERDYVFAKNYNLEVIKVIDNHIINDDVNYKSNYRMINSFFLNGLNIFDANNEIISYIEKNKIGKRKIEYKLKDWLFSRQRYWGEPFPVAYSDDNEVFILDDDELPTDLPLISDYKPTADCKAPLERADDSWLNIKLKNGKNARRETNTMPQWAGSCWYYLRFLDPDNNKEAFSGKFENYWMPVDLYVGGIEHAVLHLLYARFWHKVLYDCGLVHNKEPFKKLFNQGMILSHSYKDNEGKYYSPNSIEKIENNYFLKNNDLQVFQKLEKMSKSKLNVISPDLVIDKYGADSMRLYELFMGPLEQVKNWKTDGIDGLYRFLSRIWRLIVDENNGKLSNKINDNHEKDDIELWKLLNITIKKVTEDTENLKFNTAISQMMNFVNVATNKKSISKKILLIFLKILSPYAPHISEELWEFLGNKTILSTSFWPNFDEKCFISSEILIIIQINGKKRDSIQIKKDITKIELKNIALERIKIIKFINKKIIKKIIIVPNRLINIVI